MKLVSIRGCFWVIRRYVFVIILIWRIKMIWEKKLMWFWIREEIHMVLNWGRNLVNKMSKSLCWNCIGETIQFLYEHNWEHQRWDFLWLGTLNRKTKQNGWLDRENKTGNYCTHSQNVTLSLEKICFGEAGRLKLWWMPSVLRPIREILHRTNSYEEGLENLQNWLFHL